MLGLSDSIVGVGPLGAEAEVDSWIIVCHVSFSLVDVSMLHS